MGLRDIQFKEDYWSGSDNLVRDLFHPCLRESKNYWRAVGYFSSTALESFGEPLEVFLKKDGRIRLITSVELSESDLNAIQEGLAKRKVCEQRIKEIIDADLAERFGDGLARLARLLELDRLEIRIAVPTIGTGIYHEKVGLFFDDETYVAFSGSSNESRNAFENNCESIDVFPHWMTPSRAERKKSHFERIWQGTDDGVDVYAFPEAAKRQLLRIYKERRPHKYHGGAEARRWRHQDEALQIFLTAERGVLNMATGTGKTRTAVKILISLYQSNQIQTIIVCTDGNDLLDQWYRELLGIRTEVSPPLRIFRHYRSEKDVQSFLLEPGCSTLLVSRAFVSTALKGLSSEQSQKTLLIHDEVHGLGSPGNRSNLAGLSDSIRFRLGLSATPEREYDQEGNAFIEQHIGPVLLTFGLKEAIERGILTPFNYFPLRFELTEDDKKRIANIYRRRKAREAAGNPMGETELWIEIARVYKTSEAKLPVFKTFIRDHQNLLKRCIIFTETIDFGHEILDIVHDFRSDFHTYFSGEDKSTLQRFARGDLECLITCHRLSEGIDIQSLTTVILISSDRARLESIQRIGRCLRTSPDQPDKVANIVDFVREGREGEDPNADEDRCAWLTELSTVRRLE